MFIPMWLSALVALPLPALVDRQCDEECAAVLAAGLEWAVAQVSSTDRARIFVDTTAVVAPQLRTPQSVQITPPQRSERRAQAQTLAEIAGSRGLATKIGKDYEAWRTCMEDARSAACEAAVGATIIRVGRVNFDSEDEATISVNVSTVRRSDEFRGRFSTSGSELLLRRIDGRWQVVKKLTVIRS